MKSILSNKDNNYSLQNSENYKKEIYFDLNEAIKKYTELIIEYFKFIMENTKIKSASLSKFIIIRGLDTITNVFLNIMFYTKNIDLTYFHSQKSYYFYVEFVGQISDDEKMFLQLTSRDATTYVYKKTVFDINNELKKINEDTSNEFKLKMDILKSYINLYQTYLLKIIQNKSIDVSCISYIVKLTEKLNPFMNKSKIFILENITEKLYNKIEDLTLFFDINYLLVKHFIKNQELVKTSEEKINQEDFINKLQTLNPNKFINWFLLS